MTAMETLASPTEQDFNQAGADAFAERLVNAFNEAALCQMTSVGHRTGLFDTMADLPPSTSEDIARAANLNERYVREWLGAMVTSGVIAYEPTAQTYHLPREHAAFLTRRSTPDNLAVFAQYFPILGSVEDDIVKCFREGGGVPYSRYERFHEVMAEDSEQTVLSSLMEHIIPLMPDIQGKLEEGIRVLDVGCGRGRAVNMLATRFPRSEFVGMDLSVDAINYAKRRALDSGLHNVTFVAKDLTHFDQDAKPAYFDFITTFDAIHDQAKPLSVLKGIARSLKQDGVYLMQDIHGSSHLHNNTDHPIGTLLYTVSCMHCMSVSLAQGGEGLGTLWGQEKARELLSEAGFTDIRVHQLEHDFQNDYYISRKS